MAVVDCVYHNKATLGEGALWSPRESRLYWIDIHGHKVCRYDPAAGVNEEVDVGQPVGMVAERASGGLVAGLKDGVYGLDFESGKLEKWCDPMEGDESNRLNDGKAGPDGRLYVGCEGPERRQRLYRVERDGKRYQTIEEGVTCSNGLCWSHDRATMYYIDSPVRKVEAYDFDVDSGLIGNRRAVVDVTGEACVPDGMTIDAEGMLWVAFWEGSCVRRFDPNTGRELERVTLPVSRVTSCSFGGEKLDQLYITTASVGFEASDWEREPLAGGLFVCNPGVKGVPAFMFGG